MLWGLLTWVYIWLAKMLWKVDPAAWLFLVVISFLNISLDFIAVIFGAGFGDVSVSVIINTLILIYSMLPGVKEAFGQR